jgi:hypothetical protein
MMIMVRRAVKKKNYTPRGEAAAEMGVRWSAEARGIFEDPFKL